MKHKSNYFDTAAKLLAEKNRLWDEDRPRRARERMIRFFYNGQPTTTPQAGVADDTPDIINHLVGYKNLQPIQDMMFSVYTSTNSLFEVSVDTGSPESDIKIGARISKAINKAIYRSGKFHTLWNSTCGEICLTGRAPWIFERNGWCPRIAQNLLVPEGSPALPGEIPYAFNPVELNYAYLERLKKSVKGEEGKFVDLTTVTFLLKVLEAQIKGESTATVVDNKSREINMGVTGNGCATDKRSVIPAWEYFEVKCVGAKKELKVSRTLFTDRINSDGGKGVDDEVKIVSYQPEAYNSPDEWLHAMVVDSQIGGVKNFSTAKGVAELTFESDMDSEHLLNELIAGAKQKARPKFKRGQGANNQAINAWNVAEDSMLPEGVDPVQISSGGSGDLNTSMALLGQNSSSLAGGTVSNVGREGELRQQALERQGRNASLHNNRMSSVYTSLDRVADEIVRRFLAAENTPGCADYNEIEWVRAQLNRQKIPFKDLAKREFGCFKYIEVRVSRVVGGGDREGELTVAEALMAQLANFAPEVRPMILQRWVALMTKDTSLAESLVTLPDLIINQQRVVGENEFDTMLRRAALGPQNGGNLPIGADDVDEDHVPAHLLDLQAFLAESQYRSFNMLDIAGMMSVIDHINQHLNRMAQVPSSAGAGKVFTKALQQLIALAAPIVAKVQKDQAAQQQQLDPKTQMELTLKAGDQQINARKLGLEEAKFKEIVKSRESRSKQGDRKQYASEVKTQEQLNLAKQNLDLQKAKVISDARKNKSKSKES